MFSPPYRSLALATIAEVPASNDWLTPDERATASALTTRERRDDWRASRLAAKRAVAALLREHTPPFVLSLSHCEGHAAAVAAISVPGIGIDVERDDAVRPDAARYFLSPRERGHAVRHPITELWCLKEAAWKALRCDDSTPFRSLELRFSEGGEVEGVSLREQRFAARSMVFAPWPGFTMAVLWTYGRDQ